MSSLLSTEWPPLTILTTSGSKMKTFKRITNMCCLLMFFFFFETKWQNWAKLQSFSFSFYEPKVWNTLGDTLLQHVTMTNHWLCTGQATSCVTCCNNKPLYVLGNFCENLYLGNRIFSLNKSLLIWICVTYCRDKILLWRQGFSQNSPVHTKNLSYDCNLLPLCVGATCHLVCSALKDYHW